PSAPVRPVSETRLEVPRMAFEPRRTLPATNVRVHAGRRRPEHFEALNVGSRRLGAAFPLGEYDVARACEAVDGDDLYQLSVEPCDRHRRCGYAVAPQRHDPGEFRSDGGFRVIALPVNAERPFPSGCAILDTKGRVLGHIEQFDYYVVRQAVALDCASCQALQSLQQLRM